MQPAEKFNELLVKRVGPILKKQRYSRKGSTFRAVGTEAFELVNFQKSLASNADTVVFTVNVGVGSRRLLKFFSGREKPNLIVDDCHWRERLGFLTPKQHDEWWTIDARTPVETLGEEICVQLEQFGLPHIKKHASDKSLRDLWLSGSSPGLTNFQRLMNLSVLTRALGPASSFEAIVNELLNATQNEPTASAVKAHLRRLEREVVQID